jgi:hypothetical protein
MFREWKDGSSKVKKYGAMGALDANIILWLKLR